MISFSELTNQVHLLKDMILSDMVYDNDNSETELAFNKHLYCTKIWFSRISCANKKRFLLALLDDVRSAYTLSLLLKAMWSCRPKDAVMSISESKTWSSFDQMPMDHNRTAQPVTLLAQVMKSDRKWFLTLDNECQVMLLSELLSVSGGPILWQVLKRAQSIYEMYRTQQLQDIMECIVVTETKGEEKKGEQQTRKTSSGSAEAPKRLSSGLAQAQKSLEINLANWNAAIKSLRDSLKLEEIEMSFQDGSKRKIWKVNRQKPEATETVDFMQQLPASISKRILSYMPRANLGDYAKINKYWAYLVDDLRAEIAVRQKIHGELEQLEDTVLKRDLSADQLIRKEYKIDKVVLASVQGSMAPSAKPRPTPASARVSEKSTTHYSFRHFLNEQITKPHRVVHKPIKNMKELTELLDRRGAADENLFRWCRNILKIVHPDEEENEKATEGVLNLSSIHFPCPMMKQTMGMPLQKPLYKDPAFINTLRPKTNISNSAIRSIPGPSTRYSLWSKDFSSLYPAYKLLSHEVLFDKH